MFFFEMSRAILTTAHFSASDSMRRAEFQELLSARNFSVLPLSEFSAIYRNSYEELSWLKFIEGSQLRVNPNRLTRIMRNVTVNTRNKDLRITPSKVRSTRTA